MLAVVHRVAVQVPLPFSERRCRRVFPEHRARVAGDRLAVSSEDVEVKVDRRGAGPGIAVPDDDSPVMVPSTTGSVADPLIVASWSVVSSVTCPLLMSPRQTSALPRPPRPARVPVTDSPSEITATCPVNVSSVCPTIGGSSDLEGASKVAVNVPDGIEVESAEQPVVGGELVVVVDCRGRRPRWGFGWCCRETPATQARTAFRVGPNNCRRATSAVTPSSRNRRNK